MNSEYVYAAANRFRAVLDDAALEALRAGMDWAESRLLEAPAARPKDPGFAAYVSIMSVRAGPIAPGSDAPAGWYVIRHSEWLAAGRPGA